MALSETDKNIRENVVYLRDKTGINNAKIAKACSVSKPTVTNWILGKRTISKKNLVKLSILFGVSIDVLTSPVDRLTDYPEIYISQKRTRRAGNTLCCGGSEKKRTRLEVKGSYGVRPGNVILCRKDDKKDGPCDRPLKP